MHGTTIVVYTNGAKCPICKTFEDNAEVIRELKADLRDCENDRSRRD